MRNGVAHGSSKARSERGSGTGGYDSFGEGAEPSGDALRGWASVKVFQNIAEGIDGPIDCESVLKALNSTTSLDTPVLRGVDLTSQLCPINAYPRITVTSVHLNQIVDAVITQLAR